ncbi:hypothetical protein G6F68_008509 [Rhizopus microsporus]|nr:hypothetical protein G6F68_008509 [Rhizopus microsporus]
MHRVFRSHNEASASIPHRDNFIHSEDVYNIFRKVFEGAYKRHDDQKASVKLWLNHLEPNNYNIFINKDYDSSFIFGFCSTWQAFERCTIWTIFVSYSPEQARIHHQLFQKQAYTEEDTIFLRFPVQHEDNDDLGPCYEDGETNKSDQTIDEVVNKKAMPLASQLNRENYCNDSSDGRCSPTCTLPSKRSSLKPQPTATELGSYMPFISRVTARARMQTGRIAKAKAHGLRRCFRLRLGNQFRINQNSRFLVRGRKRKFDTQRAKQKKTCTTVQQQPDSNKVRYEARGNSITHSTSISTVDSRTTYQQPDHIDLPTHPRDAEHGRRQSQPQDYTFVGTTTSSNMVSPNQETIEGFDDRCIRSTSQSSTARILEPISRLGCGSSECVRSAVAEKRIISEHTLEINPQGNSQIKDRPGEFSSSCHATMVNAGMVADDPTSGQEEPNGVIKTTREFNITDRMEIINYYRKKKGLSPEVISVLRQKN